MEFYGILWISMDLWCGYGWRWCIPPNLTNITKPYKSVLMWTTMSKTPSGTKKGSNIFFSENLSWPTNFMVHHPFCNLFPHPNATIPGMPSWRMENPNVCPVKMMTGGSPMEGLQVDEQLLGDPRLGTEWCRVAFLDQPWAPAGAGLEDLSM